MSTAHRRKATQHLNTELATLVKDKDSFKDAAPFLFGKFFKQLAKDHMESIKPLKTSSNITGSYRYFWLAELPRDRSLGNHCVIWAIQVITQYSCLQISPQRDGKYSESTCVNKYEMSKSFLRKENEKSERRKGMQGSTEWNKISCTCILFTSQPNFRILEKQSKNQPGKSKANVQAICLTLLQLITWYLMQDPTTDVVTDNPTETKF